MKKILITLFIISIFCIINGQILLFEDNLNNGAANWTIVNGTATNKWFHGNAAVANNTGSLYVSSAAAGTVNPPHSYNASAGSRVHVYTDLPPFPQNAINITLTFDAICGGESNDEWAFDYFKVYLHPTTYTPVAIAGANVISNESSGPDETRENQIGAVTYNQYSSTDPTSPNSWTTISIHIPAPMAAGQSKRLMFTWRNDTSVLGNPPVGIDNISITYTEAADEPPNAVALAPLNGANDIFIQQTLQWRASTEGAAPTGYKLYFGTTNPPSYIGDLGLVTSWSPVPALIWAQQYFWQVIPYNGFGDATNCPIWTFTTGADPTITTFPYFENFDNYQYGTIPYGWGRVLGAPFNQSWEICVNDWGGYSPPNDFRISSGYGNQFPVLIARTPPIQNLNTKRVRFYTKGDTNTSLIVGYMTDPLDADSFVEIETINYPHWDYLPNEFFIPFGNATGDFVAFKHGGQQWANVYIDNLTIENLPTGADFRCNITSLSFGSFSQGQSGTASVLVANLGAQPLIINHVLPAEIVSNLPNPITIGAGQSQTIVYTLTPTTAGAYTGSIVMNTNATNQPQHTIAASAQVMQAGLIVIGSSNQNIEVRVPINMYYRTSYAQTIYLGDEIGITGTNITSIYYEYNGHGTHPNNIHQRDWKIWMVNTNQTQFNGHQDFIPLDDMTEVFNGTVNFVPGVEGWFEIVFDMPFLYVPGSNLCIATFKSSNPHSYGDYNAGFYATETPGQWRSINWWTDSDNHGFNENAHPPVDWSGTYSYIANIALNITAAAPGAYINTPGSINFASINQYEANTRDLLVRNLGNIPLTITSITTPNYVTINQSSATIPPESSQTFTITLTPLQIGTFTGVININSNALNFPIRSVNVSANVYPQGMIYIGDENSNLSTWEIPFTYFYNNSIVQTIYLENELNTNGNATLTHISYNFNGAGDIPSDRIVSVYMATTTTSSFTGSSSWIPYNQFTLVYQGTLPVEASGIRDIDIELDTPFEYNGDNLVIMTHKHMTTNWNNPTNVWQVTGSNADRTIYIYSDSQTYNITNYTDLWGNRTTWRPNIKIFKEDDTYPRPRNLVGIAGDRSVTLSWDAPVIRNNTTLDISLENYGFSNMQTITRNNLYDENKGVSRIIPFRDRDQIKDIRVWEEDIYRIAQIQANKQDTQREAQRNTRNFTSFKIYKNATEYMTIPATSVNYEDTQVMNDIEYTYWVTAVYPDGESHPSNTVEMIPTGLTLHPPANLTYTIQNERNVRLEWSFGQYVVNENFESWGLTEDWHNFDQDGDGYSWELATGGNMEGYQHIMSRSRTATGAVLTPQNWLISEPFIPAVNTYLNYWIGALSSQLFAERYAIRVSQNSINIEDFDDSIFAETLSTGAWERRSINLSNYSGQTIRIAFYHNTQGGQSALKLDGVQVIRTIGTPSQGLIGFNVYRNNDLLQSVVGATFNFTDVNAPVGDNFYYVKGNYGAHGESFMGNAFSVYMTSEIDEIIEYSTKLIGNYPNPFNPETTIKFSLEKESFVTIDIFNIKGQKVTTIANDIYRTGDHNVVWKGNDLYGQPVSSGVYFYQMKTDDKSYIKRMMLMK